MPNPRQLTRSLLSRDFNLTLTLPPDRLCPPVPVRWNYVRWLQDLLATTDTSTNSFASQTFNPVHPITGLDIGVGASSIYSLLACATAPAWRMHGTDIDAHSLSHARRNVERNDLTSRISLHATWPSDPLIPFAKLGVETLDFVMCNPPFYSSTEDMARAYGGKAMPPSAVCTGSKNEMITDGGDAGFVERILEESLRLRGRVRWYSSMLGRLASVQILVGKLKEHGVGNFAVTNLKAGRKTRRWAVAWSFGDARPSNEVVRHGELVVAVMPPATEWTVRVEGEGWALGERVDGVLAGLDLKWEWRADELVGVAVARENVWSRSARRKRKFQEMNKQEQEAEKAKQGIGDEGCEDENGKEKEPVALAVRITCSSGQVDIRWLRGADFLLWESFCGMLKRSLGAREQGGTGGKQQVMEER